MANSKEAAALQALEYVVDGMVLGLGTGSTTAFFIDHLGNKLATGELKGISGVPTSENSATRARNLGIPLTTLTDHPVLDLAVDGADEVDPQLNLIKGLGRALLREKVVEVHAKKFVVIVDDSKLVPRLGMHIPLPVEILPFEHAAHLRWLNSLGCLAELWLEDNGSPVVTDNGNYLAKCWFRRDQSSTELIGIDDPNRLAGLLSVRPGIIEHGLFLGMADQVIVAGNQGISILERPR